MNANVKLNQKQTVQKEFALHPAVIFSLLTKQASGVPKALLELVMNSVDAGATRIDVEIDENGYVIADNGSGFKDLETIKSFFGTFGYPHAEGDGAYYGKFRLGRAQSYTISRTKWFSKNFCMEVDLNIEIKQGDPNIPLGYTVKEDLPYYDGCKIVGEFYEKQVVGSVAEFKNMSGNERPDMMKSIIPALIKMIQYLPVPVYLNGELVTVDQSEVEFLAETDLALFRVAESDGHSSVVNVYNLGVYAYQVHTSYFSGDVISKEQIDLNMARNEAKSTCLVAKQIVQKLQGLDRKVANRLNKADRSDDADEQRAKKRVQLKQTDVVNRFWSAVCGLETFVPEDLCSEISKKVILLGNDTKTSLLKIAKQLEVLQLDGGAVYFYDQKYVDRGLDRDALTIENGFIPNEIFPSDDILEKIEGEINIFNGLSVQFGRNASYIKAEEYDVIVPATNDLTRKKTLLLGVLHNAARLLNWSCDGAGDSWFTAFGSIGGKSELVVSHLNTEKGLGEALSKVRPKSELSWAEEYVVRVLRQLSLTKREIMVRDNVPAKTVAYTDGVSTVVFNSVHFKRMVDQGEFAELVGILIHECCHKDDSNNNLHQHGASFYGLFIQEFSKGFNKALATLYKALDWEITLKVQQMGVERALERMQWSDHALATIAENALLLTLATCSSTKNAY